MIDIFEYAESHNEDYYDEQSKKMYHVKEYNRLRKFGIPVNYMKVTGNFDRVTYIHKK